MAAKRKPVLSVDLVQSKSNATLVYQIKTYEEADGTCSFWCTCPSFKFQKKSVAERHCKHTRELVRKPEWIAKVAAAAEAKEAV